MIRNTSHKVLWSGLSATLLGIALAGCGGNNASTDNAATTSPTTGNTTPSASTSGSATSNSTMPNSTSSTSSTRPTGATTSAASAASFTAAAATWKQIAAAKVALKNVVQSKKLSTVHEAAFKVRDLVKKLPAQSSGLPLDKQKTLATQVKNVEQLAGLLDKAGDSNNLQDTQDNLAGLSDALDTIRGLYPAGTF